MYQTLYPNDSGYSNTYEFSNAGVCASFIIHLTRILVWLFGMYWRHRFHLEYTLQIPTLYSYYYGGWVIICTQWPVCLAKLGYGEYRNCKVWKNVYC